MKIGIAQINTTVGDLTGNARLIRAKIEEATREKFDVVIFPEMVLPGYPPEDLLLKNAFIKDNLTALLSLAKCSPNVSVAVGFVDRTSRGLHNALAWLEGGRIKHIYRKRLLPNYGVFDEERYFISGNSFSVISSKGVRWGLTICEDIWKGPRFLRPLKRKGADILLNVSASPFHQGKSAQRLDIGRSVARGLSVPLIYANLVGGQDELVFDGGSFALSENGELRAQGAFFREGLLSLELRKEKGIWKILKSSPEIPPLTPVEEIYEALLLGLRDYVQKNGFKRVALGLSGGIDSALVCALAVHALGPDRVVGITMPSRFNQPETLRDAHLLARNLGIPIHEIPIQNNYEVALKTLEPLFQNLPLGLAEENLQARIRGNLLMALSNKLGWLILTTGNKSEMSTGYCTLYGDTAGGFAVIKDVLKTTVYALSRLINEKAQTEVIPGSILSRPPTAELRENQKDEDSLGPYSDLDPVIKAYVEDNVSLNDLIRKNPEKREYFKKIISLIDRNEYKRRQAPPGIKVTPRSFGRDHRMPITNRYVQIDS